MVLDPVVEFSRPMYNPSPRAQAQGLGAFSV
jgi:hypothetical protein